MAIDEEGTGRREAVLLRLDPAPTITDYDRRHAMTYALLLDAEAQGIDWMLAAEGILELDLGDCDAAHRCWQDHLARAHWIEQVGFPQLIELPNSAADKAD